MMSALSSADHHPGESTIGTMMALKFTDEQAVHDIRRAEDVIQEAHEISRSASSRMLRDRADDIGVSVHAAALAVLSGERPDPRIPEQRSARDRLCDALGEPGGRR